MLLQPQPRQRLILKKPPKYEGLYEKHRYKVRKGGRGSAKSHEFAELAILTAVRQPNSRILCAREYQNSITESVHRLLCDKIAHLNLGLWYEVTQTTIRCPYNNSEFYFKGLRQNFMEVKSMEGITRMWYEEAQKASKQSLDILIPTIRAPESELWFSYNPMDETDPADELFMKRSAGMDLDIEHVTFEDNPYFPEVLEKERLHMLATDPVAYEHVWMGGYAKVTEAVIFGKRVEFGGFETPVDARFFYGLDFGFANDPSALIRCFIKDDCLYIDHEAFGYGVEIDDLPDLIRTVPQVERWPIKADCSRPETISYLRRQNLQVKAAEKWQGSVEDGIAHLKGFKKIYIHERCPRMAQEARLYSYKVDKITGDILPIIVDKHNHGWDAVRYSLDGYIQKRGNLAVWDRL